MNCIPVAPPWPGCPFSSTRSSMPSSMAAVPAYADASAYSPPCSCRSPGPGRSGGCQLGRPGGEASRRGIAPGMMRPQVGLAPVPHHLDGRGRPRSIRIGGGLILPPARPRMTMRSLPHLRRDVHLDVQVDGDARPHHQKIRLRHLHQVGVKPEFEADGTTEEMMQSSNRRPPPERGPGCS